MCTQRKFTLFTLSDDPLTMQQICTVNQKTSIPSLSVCYQLHTGGIIIMKDTSEEEEELVEPVSAHGPKIEEEEQEPEPPEPFEYIDE